MTGKRPVNSSLAKMPTTIMPKSTMWCADGTCLSTADLVRRVNNKDITFVSKNFNMDSNNAFRFKGHDFALGYGNNERGNSGPSRALVKDTNNVLKINYNNDFSGGTVIDGNVRINGTLNGLQLDNLNDRLIRLEKYTKIYEDPNMINERQSEQDMIKRRQLEQEMEINRDRVLSGQSSKSICISTGLDAPGCQELVSPSGKFKAAFSKDGGVLLFGIPSENKVLWSSSTPGNVSRGPYRLIMQNDGNLVIYDKNNTPTWALNSGGGRSAPYYLSLNDAGELAIIDKDGGVRWKAIK